MGDVSFVHDEDLDDCNKNCVIVRQVEREADEREADDLDYDLDEVARQAQMAVERERLLPQQDSESIVEERDEDEEEIERLLVMHDPAIDRLQTPVVMTDVSSSKSLSFT
jgi:hypothetical protein